MCALSSLQGLWKGANSATMTPRLSESADVHFVEGKEMSESSMSRRKFMGAASVAAMAAVGAGLASCSSSSDAGEDSGAAAKPAKPVILVTSFGTSFANSRHVTIGAIEDDIREAFPEYDVRRAFTAQIIIDHIEKDTGRHINNFEEAMDQIVADGVKEVIVQPTHLMDGHEYADVKESLESYKDKLDKFALGEPLLKSDADVAAVAQIMKEIMKKFDDGETAICWMGHGTDADSNAIYGTMQKKLQELGIENHFVGTVEAEPTFADVAKAIKNAGVYKKAVLRPLMVVAGDHANNDMADEADPESFASVLKAEGLEVTSVIEGLGQVDAIDEIYVEHVKAAIESLK